MYFLFVLVTRHDAGTDLLGALTNGILAIEYGTVLDLSRSDLDY